MPKTSATGFKPVIRRKRGRPPNPKAPKRDLSTDDGASVASMTSFNSFSVLQDDDDGNLNLPGPSPISKPNPKPLRKPPPIVLLNMTDSEVSHRLSSVQNQHPIARRLTREGIKLYTATVEDFNILRSHLSLIKAQYITYALPEQQLSRFVVYGLPDITPVTLKAAINDQLKASPVDVKKMIIKDPKYPGQSNYIVYFPRTSAIRVADLKTISLINGYHVFWSTYRKTDGPVVCRNCGRFSHSAIGCGLTPRCVRCGENHRVDDCSYVNKETGLVPAERLKCLSCGLQHATTSLQCAAQRQHITEKAKKIENRKIEMNRGRFVNTLKTYTTSYPSPLEVGYSKKRSTPDTATGIHELKTAGSVWDRQRPLSSVIRDSNHNNQNKSNSVINNINHNKNNSVGNNNVTSNDCDTFSDNDTFSPNQLLSIFRELINICKTYKTKLDQLNALTNIIEKHLFNG